MLHILTLTFNGCDKLTKLKNSLIPALEGIDFTWLIKDNNSTDDTVAAASQWGDNVKVIAHKNNYQNFSQGCNLLFNEAAPKDNDDIMLLNNDIIFNDKKSIKDMLKILNGYKDIGAVGARLLYTDTNKLQHAGVVFDDRIKTPLHFRLHQNSDNNAEKNRLFQVVTGAVLLTKADFYKNVHNNQSSGNRGMDENFHWGFDDVDLCLAIKHTIEKRIVYCGTTNIYHEDSASLKKIPTNRLFLNHNLNYLRTKWNGKYCCDRFLYENDPNLNLFKE